MNTPMMLYAVSPEKHGFHSGGSVGGSAPSFWIFWIRPWQVFVCIYDQANKPVDSLSFVRHKSM